MRIFSSTILKNKWRS